MSPLQFLTPHELKIVGASVVAILAAAGDVANDLAGYESVSLKVLLLLAIGVLANELRRQRDKYEAEAARREERMAKALEDAKEAMEDLKAATIEQTGWFKTVAQNVINRDIHPKLPE